MSQIVCFSSKSCIILKVLIDFNMIKEFEVDVNSNLTLLFLEVIKHNKALIDSRSIICFKQISFKALQNRICKMVCEPMFLDYFNENFEFPLTLKFLCKSNECKTIRIGFSEQAYYYLKSNVIRLRFCILNIQNLINLMI